jgi:hypothetical protein
VTPSLVRQRCSKQSRKRTYIGIVVIGDSRALGFGRGLGPRNINTNRAADIELRLNCEWSIDDCTSGSVVDHHNNLPWKSQSEPTSHAKYSGDTLASFFFCRSACLLEGCAPAEPVGKTRGFGEGRAKNTAHERY